MDLLEAIYERKCKIKRGESVSSRSQEEGISSSEDRSER